MTPFFDRLKAYYRQVGSVLRGEAEAASVFPNSTDVGMSRETVYAEFLRQHAPSKCNVFFGGFIFGLDGSESGQLDVIITTDTAPRFNFHNKGDGKSFACVEGTLGVASIKSTLDKKELENALLGIALIPHTQPLENRLTLGVKINNYDDWPYKIIYASEGIDGATLHGHLNHFYRENPGIPNHRRPNLIHVAGKYVIFRVLPGMIIKGVQEQPAPETFFLATKDPDLQGIPWVLHELQQRASGSTHILFSYGEIINKLAP